MNRGYSETISIGRGEEFDLGEDSENDDEKEPSPPPEAKSTESPKGGKNTKKTPQKPKNKLTCESDEGSKDDDIPPNPLESPKNIKEAKPSPLTMFIGLVKKATGALPQKGKK